MTDPNTAHPRPRILTLPCGGTLAADLIAGVRLIPERTSGLLGSATFPEVAMPASVEEITRGFGVLVLRPADPAAFAAEAIELQREPFERKAQGGLIGAAEAALRERGEL